MSVPTRTLSTKFVLVVFENMQTEFENHDDEIHREQAERGGKADEHGHQEPAAREDDAFKDEFGAVQVAAATIMILVTKIPAGGFPGVMWLCH